MQGTREISVVDFKTCWKGHSGETECGWGSTLESTKHIIMVLPYICRGYNIHKVCDAGCGDLNWMKFVLPQLEVEYRGYDLFRRESWSQLDNFVYLEELDISQDIMPTCDLILCRDVFIHLPNDMIKQALARFKLSGKYLLSTSFLANPDGSLIDNLTRPKEPSVLHAKLDLSVEPFNLGRPEILIPEKYPFKVLALWEL